MIITNNWLKMITALLGIVNFTQLWGGYFKCSFSFLHYCIIKATDIYISIYIYLVGSFKDLCINLYIKYKIETISKGGQTSVRLQTCTGRRTWCFKTRLSDLKPDRWPTLYPAPSDANTPVQSLAQLFSLLSSILRQHVLWSLLALLPLQTYRY